MEKRPSRVVTVLGVLMVAPLGAFIWYLGGNEFVFASWGRYLALGVGLAVALILRWRGRGGHEVAWALLALLLYNAHMSFGGYTFLGWWAVPVFLALAAAWYPVFRRRDRLWRVLAGLCFALLVGIVMLVVFRNSTFRDHEAQCAAERAVLPPFVRGVDSPTHPYDFGGAPNDDFAAVVYGRERRLYLLDRRTGRLAGDIAVPRGSQRVTPQPGTRRLALPLWQQWGSNERLLLADLDTGGLAAEIPVADCRNLFEVEFLGDRIYALCEVSHSLLELQASPPYAQLRSVTLPGMDSYDFALDPARRRAYVSDWFSPWLVEVDLDRMAVTRRRWVGFSSFGVALGPDGNLYIAQKFHRRVRVLDPASLEVIRTIPAGYGPRDLDFDPARGLLLIGNYFDGTLDVVRLADGERLNRIFVGTLLRGLWFDNRFDRLYAAVGCGVRWLPGTALVP